MLWNQIPQAKLSISSTLAVGEIVSFSSIISVRMLLASTSWPQISNILAGSISQANKPLAEPFAEKRSRNFSINRSAG